MKEMRSLLQAPWRRTTVASRELGDFGRPTGR